MLSQGKFKVLQTCTVQGLEFSGKPDCIADRQFPKLELQFDVRG